MAFDFFKILGKAKFDSKLYDFQKDVIVDWRTIPTITLKRGIDYDNAKAFFKIAHHFLERIV